MFSGELMTCSICNKEQQSDPEVESGWTYLELDGYGFYVCDKHLGKEHWTAKQHQKAYERVLRNLKRKVNRMKKAEENKPS